MAKRAIRAMSTSPELTDAQKSQLAAKVEAYRLGVQKLHDQYWGESKFTHNPGSTAFTVDTPGSRYIRIFLVEKAWKDQNDHSKGEIPADIATGRKNIHTFIDRITGDILKPAGWKAPAKHARGNLFDTSGGLANVNYYGPNYLR